MTDPDGVSADAVLVDFLLGDRLDVIARRYRTAPLIIEGLLRDALLRIGYRAARAAAEEPSLQRTLVRPL